MLFFQVCFVFLQVLRTLLQNHWFPYICVPCFPCKPARGQRAGGREGQARDKRNKPGTRDGQARDRMDKTGARGTSQGQEFDKPGARWTREGLARDKVSMLDAYIWEPMTKNGVHVNVSNSFLLASGFLDHFVGQVLCYDSLVPSCTADLGCGARVGLPTASSTMAGATSAAHAVSLRLAKPMAASTVWALLHGRESSAQVVPDTSKPASRVRARDHLTGHPRPTRLHSRLLVVRLHRRPHRRQTLQRPQQTRKSTSSWQA